MDSRAYASSSCALVVNVVLSYADDALAEPTDGGGADFSRLHRQDQRLTQRTHYPLQSCTLLTVAVALCVVQVTTPFGTTGTSQTGGGTDGVGNAARFYGTNGIAVSPDGTFALLADAQGHVIRHIDMSTRTVTTFAGVFSSTQAQHAPAPQPGVGTAARFVTPSRVALVDEARTAFVIDSTGLLSQIDVASRTVTTLAGQYHAGSGASATGTSADGTGTGADFFLPQGVAATEDAATVFVAEGGYGTNGGHRVRTVDVATRAVTTLVGGSYGDSDGTGTSAQFKQCTAIQTTPDGATLYVLEEEGKRVRQVDVATRVVTTLAGSTSAVAGYVDAMGTSARFGNNCKDILLAGGYLYVTDSTNHRVRH